MRKVKNLTVPAKAEKPAPVQATKPTLGGSVSIRRTGSDGLAKKQAKTSSPPVVDYSDLVELNLIATDEGALPWRARAFLRGLRCKPSDWYGSDWPYGWRYRTEGCEATSGLAPTR